MSSHPKTYIGCYIQIHLPKGNVNLSEILHETLKEEFAQVASEYFNINRTILLPNISDKSSIRIDSDYHEGEVWKLDDINIKEEIARFERRFKKNIDILGKHYDEVKVHYGIVHSWG